MMNRLFVCGVAVLVAVVGCSSGTSDDGELPFDEYWAMARGSAEEMAEQDIASLIQYEEAIAACMKKAGFEYYPQSVEAEASPDPDPAAVMDPASREYRQTYGYGITTGGSEAASVDELPQESPEEAKNRQYRDGLDEPTQAAYDLALSGERIEVGGVFAPQGGCVDESLDLVYGRSSPDAQWFDLLDAMYAVDGTISSSGEKAALDREWSTCMANQSYPAFSSPDDAEASIAQQSQGLYRPDSTGRMLLDEEAQAKLQTAEIALAVTDLDCQESVDYGPRLHEITVKYQTAFVKDHRSELDAWVADMSGRRAKH